MTLAAASSHSGRSALPITGLSAVADRYDVLLCDLWGVMHNGRQAFAGAVDAVRRFRQAGGTVVFLTNAPRPHPPILEQLRGLSVPDDAFDGIVTSGDVTISAVARLGDVPMHHIGPERDLALFEAVSASTGRPYRLGSIEDAAAVVVTGLFDDRRETPADYADRLALARARDLPLICANPDIVVHVGDQMIYCAGALAKAYAALGGRTVLAGKPHAPIYEAALEVAGRHRDHPIDRARVLAIGDGLVTDVAGAAGQGLDILFITSGIHRDDFHPGLDPAADAELYAERLAALEHPPTAALPALQW